jgi:hypothetical protein
VPNPPDEQRRESLKIIGAIGVQCAFPFAGDELYGQHQHPTPTTSASPGPPRFFSSGQFQILSRVCDLILPGSAAAEVPNYIDLVVRTNSIHQQIYTSGLAWLASLNFLNLTEAQQLAILEPLCQQVDRGEVRSIPQHFFRAVKNMTADGYFTSRPGLVDFLGYQGNQVLAQFPECTLDEH